MILYECAICKKNKVERILRDRKGIRKHLQEVHGIKGSKDRFGLSLKEKEGSSITKNMIAVEV